MNACIGGIPGTSQGAAKGKSSEEGFRAEGGVSAPGVWGGGGGWGGVKGGEGGGKGIEGLGVVTARNSRRIGLDHSFSELSSASVWCQEVINLCHSCCFLPWHGANHEQVLRVATAYCP